MKDFLEWFDNNGVSMNLFINRKSRSSSWQSGILNLNYLLISLIYILVELYLLFSQSYSKRNFTINYISNPNIKFRDLDDQFMMAFCQGNVDNSTSRDPYALSAVNYSLEWTYFTRKPWLIKNNVELKLKQCNDSNFKFPPYLSNQEKKLFKKCQCISTETLNNYDLSYFFTDSYSSYLTYSLMFKNEVITNRTLYENYSDYYRNNPQRLFTYFLDSQGNLDDSSNPLESFINYDYAILSPDNYKMVDILLSKIKVEFDENIFYNCKIYINIDSKVSYGLTLDRKIINIVNNLGRNETQNNLLKVTFRASNKQYNLIRTSMKFNEFFPIIFSILMLLSIIFSHFGKIINLFENRKSLMFALFKNFEIYSTISKNIKFLKESYNEIEYNDEIIKGINNLRIDSPGKLIYHDNNTLSDDRVSSKKTLENKKQNNRHIKSHHHNINSLGSSKNLNLELKKGVIPKELDHNQVLFKDKDADNKINLLRDNLNKDAKFGLSYSLKDYCCGYLYLNSAKKLELNKKRKYFENSSTIIEYYTDSITYLRKMREIVIKYYLFTEK